MGPDPARPDPSLLLTRSKQETDPGLTRVLSDPTRKDFFLTLLEEIFQIQTQTINGRATKN